jgi:hypothetical protein
MSINDASRIANYASRVVSEWCHILEHPSSGINYNPKKVIWWSLYFYSWGHWWNDLVPCENSSLSFKAASDQFDCFQSCKPDEEQPSLQPHAMLCWEQGPKPGDNVKKMFFSHLEWRKIR